MRELLQRARRRAITHLAIDKGALALTIGLGGVVLLLLAGTQILDWYWPLLLAAVSLGIGLFQLRGHIPSRYQVAQRIDHRLALADSLSTAVYFSDHPKPGFEEVCAIQWREAERMAEGVPLEQALPLQRSRYLVPAAVLLAVASSLFVTRYVLTGSLDLGQSLVSLVADTFFSSPAEQTAMNADRLKLRPRPFDPSQPDLPPSGDDPNQELPPDAQKGTELRVDDNKQSSGEGAGEKQTGDQQNNQQDEGEGSQDGSPQDKQSGQENEREGEDKGDSSPQGQDQRSMLDKLRDAVNNLMNKMNQNEGQKTAQQQGAKQKSQKQDKGEKGDDQSEAGDSDSEADSNQQGDQANKQDAKQSNAPGQKTSEEAASGAGESDGKKDIEQAKALEAMGKLSELLGERSTQITGEMMVEVGNTKQQLRTAMTQQQAGHTDAGGEIHRDQVPLADQTYVERYFQEVRKSAPAKGPAKGPGK